jgi:hypothetical protein
MSNWLNTKDLCNRCFSGIDDDHDGDCPTCAEMDDHKAAWMKQTRFNLEMLKTLETEE